MKNEEKRGAIDLIFAFLIRPLCTGCTSLARKCDGKVWVIACLGTLCVVVVVLTVMECSGQRRGGG